MKKKINELLEKKEGFLQINELFKLHRWLLEENTDILGRTGDYLELEMTNKYGKTRSGAIRIESRDVQGIMQEVSAAMEKMMDEFKNTLVRYWNGGYLF